MTTTFVSSGVTSSGLTETTGLALEVLNGGSATVTTLSGGQLLVDAGGYAVGTTISNGGIATISAGGGADRLAVSSGGTLNVAGTVNSFTTVFSGGIENIDSGGFISGAVGSGTGISGGTVNVLAGGSASYLSVSSGGVFNVAGTVLSMIGVRNGGVENVLSGGFISGATSSGTGVSAGGILNLQAGGSAVHVGVSSGGTFNVAGSVLSNTAIYAGGVENVLSGGAISGASGSGTGISGGTLNLSAGGTAAFVGVSSGGTFNVAGTVLSNVGVYAGGVENVLSGGVVTGVTGSGTGISGGTVNVLSGGALDHLTVSSGTLNISTGGTANNITVSSGGTMNVAGTMTSNTLISAGGIENVLSGGLITGAVSSGTGVLGILNVLAGGSAAFVGVSSGGTFNVAGTVLSNVGVYAGGVENVLSGGVVTGVTGSGTGISGGTVNVLSGGALDHLTVSSGTLNVSAGGTAHNVTVSSGTLNVAGTMTSNTLISAGGVENVLSGGAISGASGSGTGISGGTLNLSAGGTAAFVGVSSGGTFNVAGTVLSNVGVYAGGVENVLSGGVVTGVTGSGTGISGGTVNVLSGGALDHLTVSSGTLNISTGGTANNITVSSGGTMNVAGTMTSNTLISAGGIENVLSGGLITGAVSSGTGVLGILNVLAGGSAAFVGVSSGGTFNVAGTVLSNVGVYAGGVENVLSGGVVTGVTGSGTGISGGTVNVLSGGALDHLTVSSGTLNVSAGGTAHNVTVSSGTLNVAGTMTSNTLISAGGVENVLSGGAISGASGSGTGISGGTLNLSAGGTAAFVGVSSGGTFNVAGTVLSNVGVYAGGVENVLSGGVVTGVTGSGTGISGGTVNVLSGGALDHLTVSSGTLNISTGGTANNITVSSGGTMNVAGTMTSNTLISAGGIENVLSGGLITGAVSSGTGVLGILNVLAGGSAAFVGVSSGGTFNVAGTVLSNVGVYAGGVENVLSGGVVTGVTGSGTGISGGTVNVLSGGALDHLTVSSGTLNVSAGGTAHNVTVSSGTLNVAGTMTSNTLISAGGVENVLSGGAISGASGSGTGISGGTLNLSAGGTAAFVGVSSGGTFNVAGTVLSNVGVYAGGVENVLSGGLITGAISSGTGVSGGGILNVLAGGSAAFVGVSSGGTFNVSGTVLNNVGVYAGGVENVFSGGVVTGPSGSGTAISGGIVNVFSGGALDHSTISSGGVVNLSAGATAHNISVSSGGAFNVAGAVTSNVAVFAGGTEIVFSGGSTGPITISGGMLELQAGSIASGGITFNGSGGQLKIDGTSLAGTTTSSLVLGDSIDLAGLNFVSGGSATLLAGNILHVTEGASSFDLQLDSTPGVRFSVSADSGTGTLVTTGADHAPVTSASNVRAGPSQTSALASNLFTVTDADNDPITTYAFWDTQGNGHWVINGVTQATNAEIDVSAANLSQVSYMFGPSGTSDTLYVRANDGTLWGSWTSFTATAFVDTAPTVHASNVTAAHAQTSVAASGLLTVSDPDAGATVTQYALWDSGTSGHWVVNGVVQAANTEIDVPAANLSQVSYVFGPSGSPPDQLYIRANDGMLWGAWAGFTATPGPDQPPTVAASNVTAAHGQTSALASSLFSVSDPESDPTTMYAFWDTGGSGHWLVNGVVQAANTEIDVAAANLSQVSYVFGPGGSTPDTLYVRANDGSKWSTWTGFTATPGPDQPPTVAASNVTAAHGQTSALASSLFSVSDPESDPTTMYAFWDTGGSGHWLVNGVAQAANTEIDVAAANLSQVSYVFGPGGSTPDTLYVRANDGSKWSTWTGFTATPGPDQPPTVAASNVTAAHGQTSALASSLFSVSDPESDPTTMYAFWDTGGSGHWLVNGVAQAANTEIDVAAANLSQVSYVFGPGGSTPDTLYVRANDGSKWSTWTGFTATPGPDQPPVVTASNVTASHGHSMVASTLFSVADGDGDSMTTYAFWDTGGNGHFVVNGVAQAANTEIGVSAANLSQVSYVFGPGGSPSDTLYVRANDGSEWSAWKGFTATATNQPPVVAVSNVATVSGQTFAASNLVTATDADGDAITTYALWDSNTNGHWSISGVAQAANTEIDVTAAQLSQATYQAGSGTDQLWIRANDGTTFGSWQSFNVKGESSSNATIAAGASLELPGASTATVVFQSSTGTLKLDNSASFAGTVAGMTGSDVIDFANVNFANVQTPSFSGDSTHGTLTVTDGTVTANIALLGNYMASTFATSSDGHGGTLVVDPPTSQVSQLAQPQHS